MVGTSPSILAPFYDRDTGLIVLHGRGEAYVQFLELSDSFVPQTVNRYEGGAAQQSLQLLPKRFCDVKNVEIFTGYRLTMGTIEKLSFTVPRLHKDYFQDDIYTATLDVENPVLSADEWVQGKTPQFKWIDLRPAEMPLRELTLCFACELDLTPLIICSLSKEHSSDAGKESHFVCSRNVRAGAKRCRKDQLYLCQRRILQLTPCILSGHESHV